MEWEYHIIEHPGRSDLGFTLNYWGKLGWQLATSGYEGGGENVLIFKRQKHAS